eukprot:6270075-Alexandrium_andersonii.AAC.1
MVSRAALSVWFITYGWLARVRLEEQELRVPDEVLEEFQTALFLAPFYSSRMDLEWVLDVYMMDSSLSGAGVVATKGTLAEIRTEASQAESRGWAATLEGEVADL